MAKIHDARMPRGWHTVKLVLLGEIHTSDTWDKIVRAADALFHARLIGEGMANDSAPGALGGVDASPRQRPTLSEGGK